MPNITTKSVQLLEILRHEKGRWLGMPALRNILAGSNSELLDMAEHLRELGYRIEAAAGYGLRIIEANTPLNVDLLEIGLNTQRVGRRILLYDQTDSTNDVAWQYLCEPNSDGLAVFAECQRRGRGRLGRSWAGEYGQSVLMSVLLKNMGQLRGTELTYLAAVAAAGAIDNICQTNIKIKWPNDLILNGKKLAGILVESRAAEQHSYVIGIGINCQQNSEDFPAEIHDAATSLKCHLQKDVDRTELARELLRSLDKNLTELERDGNASLHANWLQRCGDIGKRTTLISNGQNFTGRFIDIDPVKGLLLRLDNGPIRIFEPATTTVEVKPATE